MTFWRMQLHPDNASEAMRHAVKSLAADYVGLDFETEVGDLTRITKEQMEQLAPGQKKYRAFADEMAEGDKVLIMVHNFPFALVTVDGDYNYIRKLAPEIGVWFRHFRKVKDVLYYSDYETNARNWKSIPMPETIAPLRDQNGDTYQLIEEWLSATSALVAAIAGQAGEGAPGLAVFET
jgi:hypothetical protein